MCVWGGGGGGGGGGADFLFLSFFSLELTLVQAKFIYFHENMPNQIHCMSIKQANLTVNAHKHNLLNSFRINVSIFVLSFFFSLSFCEQVLFVYVSTLIPPRLTDQRNFITVLIVTREPEQTTLLF